MTRTLNFRCPCARSLMLSVVATCIASVSLQAQDIKRPRAVDLLPERTSLYIQIDNVQELVSDFNESNFGQMLRDERIAPFVSELYAEAQKAYADIEEQVGVSLADLRSLPTGEVCFAVVTPRRESPSFVLIVDVSEDSGVAEALIERGREVARNEDAQFETGDSDGLEYQIVRGDSADERVFYILHEGTFLAATNEVVFQEMLARWMSVADSKDTTLADNRTFATIMNKCRSIDGQPMAFSFFADPIMLARSATQGNATAPLVFGVLRTLGVDGISGIGGSAIFSEQGYASIFHGHLLLTNPREGIFEMVALKPGIYDPEPFVPENCASYMTSHWDARKFMVELEKIVDTFTSEGTFQEQLQSNVNDELEIDLQKDLIENLDGRLTLFSWVNELKAFNSQSNALALRVNDVEGGEELVEKLMARVNEDEEIFVNSEHGGTSYWKMASSIEDQGRLRRERRLARDEGRDPDDVELDDLPDEDQEEFRIELRPTQPCMGFVGDHFVITESTSFFEYLIDTHRGRHPRMVDDPRFQATMDDMKRLLGTAVPSVTVYSRPDVTLRLFYDLAQTENTKELLSSGAENNKYVAGLKRVMDENPLPPFDDLVKYFPPQGGFVVNDETGFHLLAFEKRTDEKSVSR